MKIVYRINKVTYREIQDAVIFPLFALISYPIFFDIIDFSRHILDFLVHLVMHSLRYVIGIKWGLISKYIKLEISARLDKDEH